jgi:purine catabolism regulator
MTSPLAREPGTLVRAFGITVEEALRLPCLLRATLIAGVEGRGRQIRAVNILEDPDIVRWMRGGELLLTTAYPVKQDPNLIVRLIPALVKRGVAALGVKMGPYVDSPSAELVDLADRQRFPVISIPSDVLFNDILSEVLGTILNYQALELARSEEIQGRLTRVMLEGGSLVELVQALSTLVGFPVAIIDARSRTLAAAGDAPDGTEVAPAVRVTRPIQVGDVRYGEVVVWAGPGELQTQDLMAMQHATMIAAMALAQERTLLTREQRYRTLFLTALMLGRVQSRSEAERAAVAMSWDLDVDRAVVLIDLATSVGPVLVAEQPIEELLLRTVGAALGPLSIAWGLHSGLAVLAEPSPSLAAVCRLVREAIRRANPHLQVMIGAGRVCDCRVGLAQSFQEASNAISLGREIYGGDFVLRYDELGLYRLLYQMPDLDLRRHCEEAVGPLLEYDQLHHASLLHTLEVYLRRYGNRVETARELNIHYNTLRYRLEKINQLVGGIERHATSRLDLEVAIHAQRILASRDAQGRVPARTGVADGSSGR